MALHTTEDPRRRVLAEAAALAADYLAALDERPVAPSPHALASLARLAGPLPEEPTDPLDVVRLLDRCASPATVASAGPRYFGFVTGGTLPAALGAAVLATAWDQNTGFEVMSPAGAALEMCERAGCSTCSASALAVPWASPRARPWRIWPGLAAARHAVLERTGLERRGAGPRRRTGGLGRGGRRGAREPAEGRRAPGLRPRGAHPRAGGQPGADALGRLAEDPGTRHRVPPGRERE